MANLLAERAGVSQGAKRGGARGFLVWRENTCTQFSPFLHRGEGHVPLRLLLEWCIERKLPSRLPRLGFLRRLRNNPPV